MLTVVWAACGDPAAPACAPPFVCGEVTADTTPEPPPDPVDLATCGLLPSAGAFDDHTAPSFPSRACFYAFAAPEAPFDPSAPESALDRHLEVKFTLVDLLGGSPPAARFYRNDFYRLHDEWYWFRLLNGQRAPGSDADPVTGYAFPTISSIYRALANVSPLPLGLVFIGATGGTSAGRLYAPRFYDLAGLGVQGTPRVYGLGTLLHAPPDARRLAAGRIHAFQVEYNERPDAATLARYFAGLRAALPADLAAELRFLARSPAQEALVRTLRASDHPLRTRLLLPEEVTARGGYAPYHRGLTAGYLHLLGPLDPTHALPPDAIAVLARVPDDIPPVRAILSDVAQTPLAHVALLAEARDTPNAWAEGLARDSRVIDYAYLRQPMIVSVGDTLALAPISAADYSAWQLASRPLPVSLSPLADPEQHPRTLALEAGPAAPVALVGGKVAGVTRLLGQWGLETPPDALAITGRPYAAWFAPLRPRLEALAAHPAMADRHVRYAVLDGLPAFEAAFEADPPALATVDRFLAADGAGEPFAPVLAAGGLQRWLQAQPVPYAELRPVREALAARFSGLSHRQGLRFRSSATVEDIPGFNGAGLYRSASGFLEPQRQDSAEDRARSVERALLDVWSSYWGFAPWEERAAAGLDHFAGAMAVLVHPRFDDDRERANLVMTLRCDARAGTGDFTPAPTPEGADGAGAATPDGATVADGPACRLVINAAPGSRSVTNPGGTLALPEILEVSGTSAADADVVRVQAASDAAGIITETTAKHLYAAARRHLAGWLAADNALRPPSEAARSLTLDYELKWVGEGWPARADGAQLPSRFIWRQARVLDRPLRVPARPDPWLGEEAPLTAHLPVDLNPDAEAITALTCTSDALTFRLYRLRHGGGISFDYKAFLRREGPLEGFTSVPGGDGLWLAHASWARTGTAETTTLALTGPEADVTGLEALTLTVVTAPTTGSDGDGTLTLAHGATRLVLACALREEPVWSGPQALLEALLARVTPL